MEFIRLLIGQVVEGRSHDRFAALLLLPSGVEENHKNVDSG